MIGLNKFYGFFAFQLFYMTLVVDEMYGHGLSNSERCESLPKKTKVMPTVATRQRASIIKVSGLMHSDTFKRSLGLNFTVIILYYCKVLLLKHWSIKQYKLLKIFCMYVLITMHYSDQSLTSFDMIVYYM